MNRFRTCISYLLLITFTLGNIFAMEHDEGVVMHSLDELPSIEEFREVDTHEEVLDSDIALSKTLEILGEDDTESISLIAARESYKKRSQTGKTLEATVPTSLTPGFLTNPFHEELSPIETFFQNKREEALASLFMGEAVEQDLKGKSGKVIKTDKKVRMSKEIPAFRGNIQAELEGATDIITPTGETLSGGEIGVYEVTPDIQAKGNTYYEKKRSKSYNRKKGRGPIESRTFEFGIPGKHLIFSKPVKLSLDTPGITDGAEMEIAVLHTGDIEFNTRGLSTSPDTLCNADGTATIPGNLASVQEGKVIFYTCGASSFTMNPTGGTTGSNDLRLIIGDCGQFQLYYNSGANVYTGNPPATGCNNTLDSWIALRIGATTYGSDWTAWSTNTTTGTTIGNTYTGRTTLTRIVGGRTYTLILNWRYTAPNKFFTIDWSMTIPVGNTNNVRFYIGNDSTVGGADANDVGYTGSAPSQTIGVYDNVLNQMSAIRYLSGVMWTAQQADGFNAVRTQINNGVDFTNNIQTTAGDLGFGVNWNFGTGAGTRTGSLEWRMIPYSTGSIVDLVPGIGQPEGPLTVNYLSQIPITITNAGTISSSGNHVSVLTIPTNITGPGAAFTDNGWSCGAQTGSTVTCSKTTTIASLASETFRIPVTPTLAASGSVVTFTGTISNSGDTVPANNSAFASNSVVSANLTINPGGVASPILWLRANNGTNCTTSGCTVTTWTNSGSAGTGANAVTGSGTVIYSSGALINGNPTLYFNNASLNTNNTLSITSVYSIFTMTKIGTNGKFPIGTQTGVANALEWVTTPTYDTFKLWGGATSFSGANSRGVNVPAITSTVRTSTGVAQDRTNGFQFQTGTLATAITASALRVGGTATTAGTLANVGEVIIYNTTLTGTNLNKVESYLATKYGITLNQSTTTNYTLSNDSIGMNGTVMAGYLNNIAGIARDDNSTLNQRTSQSVTNTGDILVSVSTIGTNYSSLYWGNDGGATGSLVTTDIATGSTRITREWKFEENNTDIGTVTISYATGALPVGFTGPLMLFVDADGTFASGATYYTGTLNSTGRTWDFSVNITDGQYITFGKNPSSDTTPPTILTNSLASGSLLPTGNYTLVVTYSDTGTLINTGSFTGQIYSWNTGSSTWNVTNLAPTYMSITGTTTTTTGSLRIANLPYGKYRFDIAISDNGGNTSTGSYTYFIDAIEWTIDSDIYNVGDIVNNITKFGTGELVVTVRTVGAGFTITTAPITNFVTPAGDTIAYWNGTLGWGYDLWNGFSYSGTLTSHSPSATLGTQVANINQSGQKNTYTYRIKYGTLVNAMQVAGNYQSTVRFSLNLTY